MSAGAVLIYRGAAVTGELGAMSYWGIALFALAIAMPLISQVRSAIQQGDTKSEDV